MSRFSVLILVSSVVVASLGTPASAAEKLVAPPYLVSGTNHVIVGVTWDEAVVRKMLPPGVEPVADMSGGINTYQTKGGYGLGPYQSSYFWINIEGVDSADGAKARWMLQGVYGPEEKTSSALRAHFGLPVRNGTSRNEATADGIRAIGTVNGHDFVTVEVKSKPETCKAVAGTHNYPAQNNSSGQIAVNQIPYAGQFCNAEPISVNVTAPAGDPFEGLKPVKVLWAGEFKNGSFSFSRPLPLP